MEKYGPEKTSYLDTFHKVADSGLAARKSYSKFWIIISVKSGIFEQYIGKIAS